MEPESNLLRQCCSTIGVAAIATLIIFFAAVGNYKSTLILPLPTYGTHTVKHVNREQNYGCGVHVETIRGQEVVWELPRRKPVGLPEERRLRTAALRRRLALVGISSLDRVNKRCWAELKKDGGRNVAAILRDWIEREDLKGVPLYTMGASSGGQMALTLPRHMRVSGVYAQVRGVENSVLKLPKSRFFPPTAFVHMPRDPDNAQVIGGNIETLKKAGTPVLEVQIHPRPVTVEFLTERSSLIDTEMAERIVAALQESGVVGKDFWLTEPPRPVTDRWAPLVQPMIGNLSLVLDESHVGELVNLAWAKHELVSDEAEAIMTWLQGDGQGTLEEARERAEKGGEEVWGFDEEGEEFGIENKEYCETLKHARRW